MRRLALFFVILVGLTVISIGGYLFYQPRYITRHNFMLACDYTLMNQTTPWQFAKNLFKYRHQLKDRDILHKLLCDLSHLKEKMKDGDIVYVSSNDFEKYAKELVFNGQKKVIFLVKGDPTFPNEYSYEGNIEELLEHENLLHIFVENNNYQGPSKKISSIPIGICHGSNYKFPYSRKELDRTFDKIVEGLKPTDQREIRPLCDFHFANSSFSRKGEVGEDRKEIAALLKERGICDFLDHRIPQVELWKKKGERAFDISPIGNGYDCYRTWEALLLGCIVIVKSSFLDPLFEGLPVIIVKDWSEVTEDQLRIWLDEYGDVLHDPAVREKLTHQYWLNRIKSVKSDFKSA